MGVRDTKNHCADTAGLVGYIGGTTRCDLHHVKMPTVRKAVDIGAERLVDLVKDECFLELGGAVGGEPVEAGRH